MRIYNNAALRARRDRDGYKQMGRRLAVVTPDGAQRTGLNKFELVTIDFEIAPSSKLFPQGLWFADNYYRHTENGLEQWGGCATVESGKREPECSAAFVLLSDVIWRAIFAAVMLAGLIYIVAKVVTA